MLQLKTLLKDTVLISGLEYAFENHWDRYTFERVVDGLLAESFTVYRSPNDDDEYIVEKYDRLTTLVPISLWKYNIKTLKLHGLHAIIESLCRI